MSKGNNEAVGRFGSDPEGAKLGSQSGVISAWNRPAMPAPKCLALQAQLDAECV